MSISRLPPSQVSRGEGLGRGRGGCSGLFLFSLLTSCLQDLPLAFASLGHCGGPCWQSPLKCCKKLKRRKDIKEGQHGAALPSWSFTWREGFDSRVPKKKSLNPIPTPRCYPQQVATLPESPLFITYQLLMPYCELAYWLHRKRKRCMRLPTQEVLGHICVYTWAYTHTFIYIIYSHDLFNYCGNYSKLGSVKQSFIMLPNPGIHSRGGMICLWSMMTGF